MNPSKSLKFKQIKREAMYDGYFALNRYTFETQLFQGGWSESFQREIFERGHAAAGLLLDPVREEVVLVEQFRPGAVATEEHPWLLELVAGVIEEGEQPDEVFRRESVEESGCEVKRVRKICDYLVSPGGTTERVWLFLGEIDSQHIDKFGGLDAEHEDILIHKMKVSDLFEKLEAGKLNNAMTLIAVQWLKLNWTNSNKLWSE